MYVRNSAELVTSSRDDGPRDTAQPGARVDFAFRAHSEDQIHTDKGVSALLASSKVHRPRSPNRGESSFPGHSGQRGIGVPGLGGADEKHTEVFSEGQRV